LYWHKEWLQLPLNFNSKNIINVRLQDLDVYHMASRYSLLTVSLFTNVSVRLSVQVLNSITM
jgi:hypothetical protein